MPTFPIVESGYNSYKLDFRTLTNFDMNYMDSLVRISMSLPEGVVIRR